MLNSNQNLDPSMLAAIAALSQGNKNAALPHAPQTYAPGQGKLPLPITPDQAQQMVGQYIQGPQGQFEVIPNNDLHLWLQALAAGQKAAGQ